MAKRRAVNGIPLIERKPEGDCPAGGYHEDLPLVDKYVTEDGDDLITFFCLKCHLVHWAVFLKDAPKPKADVPTNDENPLLDGIPHI